MFGKLVISFQSKNSPRNSHLDPMRLFEIDFVTNHSLGHCIISSDKYFLVFFLKDVFGLKKLPTSAVLLFHRYVVNIQKASCHIITLPATMVEGDSPKHTGKASNHII